MENTENTLDINRSLGAEELSNYETYDEPFISLAGGSARFEPIGLHGSNVFANNILQTQGPPQYY
jgi:hypothetical protein